MWWITLRHCVYCGVCLVPGHVQPHGRDTASRDHLVPKSMGGRETVDACEHCNGKKKNSWLEDWLKSRSLADRRRAVKQLPGTQEPVCERVLRAKEALEWQHVRDNLRELHATRRTPGRSIG